MRYGADHKEKTRARVLSEAARAIRAEGPHRIAVADVMARAGLTHGGFYAHFKSKDDLVANAIGEMFADARRRFATETEGYDAEEGLGRYIDFYLSARHRDRADTGCPLPALAADLPRLTPAAKARYGEGVAALTHALYVRLAHIGRPDAQTLAPSILSELVGALSLARAVGGGEQSDGVLAASRTAVRARVGLAPSPQASTQPAPKETTPKESLT